MRRRRTPSKAARDRMLRRRMRARRGRSLLRRAPARTVAVPIGGVVAVSVAAAATGYLLVGTIIVTLAVLSWLVIVLRATRLEPAGPGGDGPTPRGGAGVREPRRPLPIAPAGAAARPLPEEEPPQRPVVRA